MNRLTDKEIEEWANRNDITRSLMELRCMVEDASSINPGERLVNGIPTSEDPPGLQ